MIASIMDDFNAKRSPEEVTKPTEQLREENAALRQENATLRQECAELAEQLTAAQAARAQAEAELSTLTDAAQVLQDDREELQRKNSELQAAVDRLTDMLWGRRSEKRVYGDQPTLFDLQSTPDELSAREQEIVAAEDLLSDAAKKKLLEELLRRRKARRKRRLKERGREDFPEHLERRQVDLDLDEVIVPPARIAGQRLVTSLQVRLIGPPLQLVAATAAGQAAGRARHAPVAAAAGIVDSGQLRAVAEDAAGGRRPLQPGPASRAGQDAPTTHRGPVLVAAPGASAGGTGQLLAVPAQRTVTAEAPGIPAQALMLCSAARL